MPYDLTVSVDRPDSTIERIEQRLWVTRKVAATPEIYDTYRLTMYLLDRQWLDVPVERPGGFIFRSRIAYIDVLGGTGAPMQVADAVIVDKKYQLLPQTYFDIPGDEVAMPGNIIPHR